MFGKEDCELPCELHHIEPGIIFNLTSRNGSQNFIVDQYPVPTFNNLYHRTNNHVNQNDIVTQLPSKPNSIGNSPQSIVDRNSNCDPNNDINDNNNENEKNEENDQQNTRLRINSQPLYVNPKQYYRILRRREIRTQLRNRLIRENKVQTLYNVNGRIIKFKSRHRHAKKRPRGPGGQFLKKQKTDD